MIIIFVNFISVVSAMIGIIGFLFSIESKRIKWLIFAVVSIIVVSINISNERKDKTIANKPTDTPINMTTAPIQKDTEEIINSCLAQIDELLVQDSIESIESAYTIISQIIKEVNPEERLITKREQILLKYEDKIIQTVQKLRERGEIDDALALLDNANIILKSTVRMEREYQSIAEQQLRNSCIKFDDMNDYEGAIHYLRSYNSTESNIDVLQVILEEYEEKYRNVVLEEAEYLLGSEGYLSAINYLKESLSVLPDDKTVLNQIEQYKEYKPVSIFDMEPFQGTAHWFKTTHFPFNDETDWLIDMYGNVYHDGYIAYHGNEEKKLDVVYNLDGRYSTCTVMMAWPRGNKNMINTGAYIKFYDNGQLLYTSPEIKCGDEPIEFTFDVTGVEKLGFEKIATGKGSTWSTVTIIYPYFDLYK